MKKILTILVGALLGFQSIASEKAPLMPRKTANGEYSLVEAEKFALDRGVVSNWWRENAILIINKGLTASGESFQIDSLNIHWVFEHTTYEFKDLGPYTNSRLSDGVPEWFEDKDGWSGTVAVFRYKKCTLILYKTQCMNLLNIPVKAPVVQNPPPGVIRKDSTVVSGGNTYNYITVTATATGGTNTNTNTAGGTASGEPTNGRLYMGEEPQFVRQRGGGLVRVISRVVRSVRLDVNVGNNNNNYQPQQWNPRVPRDADPNPFTRIVRYPNDADRLRFR